MYPDKKKAIKEVSDRFGTKNNDDLLKAATERVQKLTGTFWGITAFFNPVGFKNKHENYVRFRNASKKQGLNLLTVELSYGDNPFEIKKNETDSLIQLRVDKKHILWEKEALLNIGLKHLPNDCDKVAWFDCDILLKKDDWLKETASLLEKYLVVQPYSQLVRLKQGQFDIKSSEHIPEGIGNGQKRDGFVYTQTDARCMLKSKNKPVVGGAWAARKEILDEFGFYDRLIIGSGDRIMAYAFYGIDDEIAQMLLVGESFKKDRDSWAKAVYARVNGSVSFTPGVALCLWHGDLEKRRYFERNVILMNHNFDFHADVKKDENGVLVWASDKPELHQEVKNYFLQRDENISIVLENIKDAYIRFLGFCGKGLKDRLPFVYSRLKKYFPDKMDEKPAWVCEYEKTKKRETKEKVLA
ncbi:MAG TPA: hypothetical protein PLO78_03390 [Candidatus Omnitrophota bacterium]|nr:hypothetical protein [Candidatus Omnitrophota bacterium]